MKHLMPRYSGKPMFWGVEYAIWEYRDRMKWREVRRRRLVVAWIAWNALSIAVSFGTVWRWM